jgi:demethylmenaquinone methyltransferase/2-methoxy-6-polyprenyl-1,4-benzoquinol methylase
LSGKLTSSKNRPPAISKPQARPGNGPTLLLTRESSSGDKRRRLNRSLFNHIAPGYDRMNTILSLGRDRAWKRLLVASLPEIRKPRILDLATGTGDLAFLLSRRYPDARIIGLDLSEEMLALAKSRALGEKTLATFSWKRGDMAETGLTSGCIDLVTAGYALRNAPDLGATLAELARVLKPGGVAAILEFSKSPHLILQKLELAFLWLWGGFWGFVVHRNRHVYQYFAHSLALYPDHRGLVARFEAHGLIKVADRALYFGMLRIQLFRKSVRRSRRNA